MEKAPRLFFLLTTFTQIVVILHLVQYMNKTVIEASFGNLQTRTRQTFKMTLCHFEQIHPQEMLVSLCVNSV